MAQSKITDLRPIDIGAVSDAARIPVGEVGVDGDSMSLEQIKDQIVVSAAQAEIDSAAQAAVTSFSNSIINTRINLYVDNTAPLGQSGTDALPYNNLDELFSDYATQTSVDLVVHLEPGQEHVFFAKRIRCSSVHFLTRGVTGTNNPRDRHLAGDDRATLDATFATLKSEKISGFDNVTERLVLDAGCDVLFQNVIIVTPLLDTTGSTNGNVGIVGVAASMGKSNVNVRSCFLDLGSTFSTQVDFGVMDYQFTNVIILRGRMATANDYYKFMILNTSSRPVRISTSGLTHEDHIARDFREYLFLIRVFSNSDPDSQPTNVFSNVDLSVNNATIRSI